MLYPSATAPVPSAAACADQRRYPVARERNVAAEIESAARRREPTETMLPCSAAMCRPVHRRRSGQVGRFRVGALREAPLRLREGLLAVGVAREDEEEVGETVDDAHGVGVLARVSGGDEATLRAARYGAGDVEKCAEPALTGDDELLGDLCSAPPLREGVVEEPQVILADHIILLRHRHITHYAVEEAL